MSDPRLPESGREREIFLYALRRFSNECEPPDLIRECPFSVDLPDGGRGCGEECVDLLARYRVPSFSEEVPLGVSGIAASPMARSTGSRPDLTLKPFDAAEWYYRDSDNLDRNRWQTPSLFVDVGRKYLPPISALSDPERRTSLLASVHELEKRGFDVDSLLRFGYSQWLAEGLTFAVAFHDLLAAEGKARGSEVKSRPQPPKGWSDLLDAVLTSEGAAEATQPSLDELAWARDRADRAMASDFRGRCYTWACRASFDDLVELNPPSVTRFLAYDPRNDTTSGANVTLNRWLADRFSQTYLSAWSFESLKMEWRFRKGAEEPSCPRREMATRTVEEGDLACALAEAASKPTRDPVMPTLQNAAIRLLGEGHGVAAAAIFDAARHSQWDNAELQNNFGFCLLLEDPQRALEAFDLASQHGYSATNGICNRMLALSILGRRAAALEVAEDAVDRWETLDGTTSILWDFASSVPRLLERQCPRCYLLSLAVHIAEQSEDETVAHRWRDVRARLGSGAEH